MNLSRLSILAFVFALCACGASKGRQQASALVDTLATDGRFTTLVKLLEATNATDALDGQPFTLLAPTDDAFAKLPEGSLERQLRARDPKRLRWMLEYHFAKPDLGAQQLRETKSIDTFDGYALPITIKEDRIIVSDAVVVSADIQATNGIIHAIDRVLAPPGKYFQEKQTPDKKTRRVQPDQWWW